MQSTFFAAACLTWLIGCLCALLYPKAASNTFLSAILLTGNLLALICAFLCWDNTSQWQAPFPIYFGVAPFAIHFDSLAAVFLSLLSVVGISISLYSPDYLSHQNEHLSRPYYWSFLFLFMLSMSLVLVAANVLTFMVFWELMSISSAALVAADFLSAKSQRATLIYLGATRLATAFLAGGFLWFHAISQSWSFDQWNTLSPSALGPATLVLIGLCIKAGVWPFHIWLPYAHPAAPSPVSALMSGVMIKVALYAIIRLFCLNSEGSMQLAGILFFLGVISAIWGVLFAVAQHDLKRLLAYSSIENVGIILIALATCLFAHKAQLSQLALIALTAAIFHCFNHGILKSLLFLGAGAIDWRTKEKDLRVMGGLGRQMPHTAFWFLIASAAICALPPLNGFASKWLVYQGLFHAACTKGLPIQAGLALASIGALALVGGLALVCFTMAVGVTFLGRPRSHALKQASEVTPPMVAAQALLGIICIALGLLSPFITQGLALKIAAQTHIKLALPSTIILPMPLLALALFTMAAFLYLAILRRPGAATRTYLTWECGFGALTPRMQTTAESFVQPVLRIFRPIFQYRLDSEISGKDKRHFPESIKAETEIVSLLETRIYGPLVIAIRLASTHLAKLQAGSIHLYLLYVLATLIILLAVGVRS